MIQESLKSLAISMVIFWRKNVQFVYGGAAATAAKSLQSCPTPSDPITAAYQAPLPMGFARQEYWSGVPLPLITPQFHQPIKATA